MSSTANRTGSVRWRQLEGEVLGSLLDHVAGAIERLPRDSEWRLQLKMRRGLLRIGAWRDAIPLAIPELDVPDVLEWREFNGSWHLVADEVAVLAMLAEAYAIALERLPDESSWEAGLTSALEELEWTRPT
jgi:hypothetical protein